MLCLKYQCIYLLIIINGYYKFICIYIYIHYSVLFHTIIPIIQPKPEVVVKLARTITTWFPESLVCKRFNVAQPNKLDRFVLFVIDITLWLSSKDIFIEQHISLFFNQCFYFTGLYNVPK